MAQKRMFDKSVVRRDDFIEMPDSTQNLYFHLSIDADDDGFVDNWKSVMRMTGCKDDDLKLLITKQFIIPFDSGVLVIKHWRINNLLRADRYHETKYLSEKSMLKTEENQEYTLGIPVVYQLATENSIEENRKEKNSIEEYTHSAKKKYGLFKRILLTDEEYTKLINEFTQEFIDAQINKLDEYVESNNNKNKYSNWNLVLRKSIRENWFKDKKDKIQTENEKIYEEFLNEHK